LQDLTLVDLTDLLPTATVMVVSVTGSSTSGKPLSDDDLRETLLGCAEVMQLFEDRSKVRTIKVLTGAIRLSRTIQLEIHGFRLDYFATAAEALPSPPPQPVH
jgi:hypothetical protein